MPLVAPGPELTTAQAARYARTIAVAGIGELGQRRLLAARVLVIGAGGLGSPALPYLAGAGVGHLTIVDDDTVAEHNLQRQVLHDTPGVGRPKATSAAERLRALNPEVDVVPVLDRLTDANAAPLVADHDLVLDCTDNVATRLVIADAAAAADRPIVWGAVSGTFGQVTVFWASRGHALRDLWPTVPEPARIDDVGAFGPMVGTIGTLMAGEAVKLITGAGRPLLGRVLYLDSLGATLSEIPLNATPSDRATT